MEEEEVVYGMVWYMGDIIEKCGDRGGGIQFKRISIISLSHLKKVIDSKVFKGALDFSRRDVLSASYVVFAFACKEEKRNENGMGVARGSQGSGREVAGRWQWSGRGVAGEWQGSGRGVAGE